MERRRDILKIISEFSKDFPANPELSSIMMNAYSLKGLLALNVYWDSSSLQVSSGCHIYELKMLDKSRFLIQHQQVLDLPYNVLSSNEPDQNKTAVRLPYLG